MPDATDFLRVNQIGPQEDLEFTNSNDGPTIFVMRGAGAPTSSADTNAVLTYGYTKGNFISKQQYFSGSQSSSLDSDGNQFYQVSFENTGSQRVNGDTLEVHLNGMPLRRGEVVGVHSSDYYLSGTDKVVIYNVTGSYGYSLKQEDKLKVKFTQGY